MDRHMLGSIKHAIIEYGPDGALKYFIQSLKDIADDYSDDGLKERARYIIEFAELLEEIRLDC